MALDKTTPAAPASQAFNTREANVQSLVEKKVEQVNAVPESKLRKPAVIMKKCDWTTTSHPCA
jgi:hypothetical protein